MVYKGKPKKNIYERKSKNIFEKGLDKDVFCINIPIEYLDNLNENMVNSTYFLKKIIVKHSGKNERIFVGKLGGNASKGRYITERDILKLEYHQSIVKEYITSIRDYCSELNMLFSNEIEATTSYRLIVGLGNPSVTETSMTLHKIYGIPYIPGQALKGIIRSYFLEKHFNIEKKEFYKMIIDNKQFNLEELYKFIFGDDIYGEENEKGNVIFFDSFPVSKEITIEKDVMTPHYKEYYGNGQSPTDMFKTNPISFYTVKDTKFRFMFALSKKKSNLNNDNFIENKTLKEFILNLIKEALEDHGVGAKTSVGYGYFDIDKE